MDEVKTPGPVCKCGRRMVIAKMTIVISEGLETGIIRGCAACFKTSDECTCPVEK